LSGLARHFLQLHSFAAATARGTSPEQAVKSLRPRPHFKREPTFITHSRKWGTERLLAALPLIQDAVKRSRLHPDLEQDFAERLVLTLHHKAA
jgi:DNA polymerase III delta subunit